MILLEAIEVHDKLNPKIWNEDTTMKTEVETKLLDIANEFIDNTEIPLNIVDIEVVGSNASYNYNENSDIDLHIIVNSEVNFMDKELLQQFYNAKKSSFNDKYDISVHNIPVELYIEDVKDGNATNGRYSILKSEWLLFPEPINYDIPDISQDLQIYLEKCENMLQSNDAEQIRVFINDLYMMRKLGLAKEGEASKGNLIFKELRNMNMLSDLRDRYYELRSDNLSLN